MFVDSLAQILSLTLAGVAIACACRCRAHYAIAAAHPTRGMLIR